MLSIVATSLLILVALALVALTILPMTNTPIWWIRAMVFPRLHYVFVMVPLIALTLWWRPFGWPVIAGAVTLCLAYQVWRVLPYTSLVRREIHFAPEAAGSATVSFMAANVLMENDRYADLGAEIDRADPDVLFLMETDAKWSVGLTDWLDRYPTVLRHPKDNHYGLILATRLNVRDMRVRYLTTDDTPTAFAELETRDGRVFRFVGMHPQPPVPGVDTDDRDAQIAYGARFALEDSLPVVVMGDFNAVAWSDVSESFKTVGGYLDPRVGRGPLPSFDATHRLMRFPIDQLYVTKDVAVVSFGRGEPFGSDHFPMFADLAFDDELAARHNHPKPPLSEEREETIRRMVDAHADNLKASHGSVGGNGG